jgi:hypothetical protein
MLKVALSTTNLTYKHFALTRSIHVPMDIRIMTWDMHNNVMMVNWFPNGITDIHERLNTLSFTIAIISNEEGQDKKHTLLELIVSFAS